MKPVFQRIIAISLVCLPGVLAIYGWTTLRDLFFEYTAGQPFEWFPFLKGIGAFGIGLFMIGHFIFYREKKNYKVQDKLLTEEEREEKARNKKKGGSFLEKV